MHCIGRFPEKPEIAAGHVFSQSSFLLTFYLKHIKEILRLPFLVLIKSWKKSRVVVVFYPAAATIRTKTGPEITAV